MGIQFHMEDVLILKKQTNKQKERRGRDRTLRRKQQDLHLQQQINKLVKKKKKKTKHLLDLGTIMVLLPSSFGEKKIKGSYLHLQQRKLCSLDPTDQSPWNTVGCMGEYSRSCDGNTIDNTCLTITGLHVPPSRVKDCSISKHKCPGLFSA